MMMMMPQEDYDGQENFPAASFGVRKNPTRIEPTSPSGLSRDLHDFRSDLLFSTVLSLVKINYLLMLPLPQANFVTPKAG